MASGHCTVLFAIPHHMVLADEGFELAREIMYTGCNNMPAVACQTKGSTMMANRATTILLQQGALHQWDYGYIATFNYLQGVKNKMMDDASQQWELSDEAFLFYSILIAPTHMNVPGRCSPWSKRSICR
jgi:hypothetical protein